MKVFEEQFSRIIKYFYGKLFGGKLFNKLLFFDALILCAAIFSNALIFSSNISLVRQTKEVNSNMQILQNINHYMERTFTDSVNILKQMYSEDNRTVVKILDFIQYDYDRLCDEYISSRLKFENYIVTNMFRNKDIRDIVFYKSINNTLYLTEKGKPLLMEIDPTARSVWQQKSINVGLYLLPSSQRNYIIGENRVYSMVANVFSPIVMEKIGEIVFDFDTDSINSSYSDYASDLIGTILVITSDGSIIYDSSNQLYGQKYQNAQALSLSKQNTFIDNINIINSIRLSDYGLIIVGIIPKIEIYNSIVRARQMIFIVAFICFSICFLIAFWRISFYSKRINNVVSAMKKVQEGDFSIEFSSGNQRDEIGLITRSFEEMCGNLKQYIDKVYVSSIKQKNAELKALQSQINPHFLYNTLEAIRMRALVEGNEDVGDMMTILATIFRRSIKGDMISKISDEIKYCKMYLELFKIRYKDSLSDSFEISDDVQEYGIITHLIQPIVENYIIHGIRQGDSDNRYWVKGTKIGNDIILEFLDNGQGISKDKLDSITKSFESYAEDNIVSCGLANVNERIKIIFGKMYGLEVLSTEGIETKVTLKIPAKTTKELSDYVQSINC